MLRAALPVIMIAALPAAQASAASWSVGPGCFTGDFCNFRVALNNNPMMSTVNIDDWTFTDDPNYGDGYFHNDQVRYARNRFTTGRIRLYANAGFDTGRGSWCIGMGDSTGLLPYGTANGASSFQRLAC